MPNTVTKNTNECFDHLYSLVLSTRNCFEHDYDFTRSWIGEDGYRGYGDGDEYEIKKDKTGRPIDTLWKTLSPDDPYSNAVGLGGFFVCYKEAETYVKSVKITISDTDKKDTNKCFDYLCFFVEIIKNCFECNYYYTRRWIKQNGWHGPSGYQMKWNTETNCDWINTGRWINTLWDILDSDNPLADEEVEHLGHFYRIYEIAKAYVESIKPLTE